MLILFNIHELRVERSEPLPSLCALLSWPAYLE